MDEYCCLSRLYCPKMNRIFCFVYTFFAPEGSPTWCGLVWAQLSLAQTPTFGLVLQGSSNSPGEGHIWVNFFNLSVWLTDWCTTVDDGYSVCSRNFYSLQWSTSALPQKIISSLSHERDWHHWHMDWSLCCTSPSKRSLIWHLQHKTMPWIRGVHRSGLTWTGSN